MLEQLVTAVRLVVVRIPDPRPSRLFRSAFEIRSEFPLRDDALEVALADEPKEIRAALFDMARVQHAAAGWHEALKLAFARDQRFTAQIAAGEPEQVEGDIAPAVRRRSSS